MTEELKTKYQYTERFHGYVVTVEHDKPFTEDTAKRAIGSVSFGFQREEAEVKEAKRKAALAKLTPEEQRLIVGRCVVED